MTMNLYWQPVITDASDLDDQLKFAMRKRFDGHVDGTLNESDAAYLQGLRDAGLKDAQKLLDAIAKHGEIRVFER